MKSLLFKISFLLFFCSPVLANDLLIFYSSNESSQYSNLKSEFEDLGFTVTGSTSGTVSSSLLSGKELVIDITGTSNCGSTCKTNYESFIGAGGHLIIAAENGATNRLGNIEQLVESKLSVGAFFYYSSYCNDCYYSNRRGDFASSTSSENVLPGTDTVLRVTDGSGTTVASNSYQSDYYSTWHQWEYGSNGGTITVTTGYGQFLSTATYSVNMDALYVSYATELSLYSATPTYSSAPTTEQLNKRTSTRNITNSGNGVYIDQAGNNLDLDVIQDGDDNLIAGTSTTSNTTSDAIIDGDYNTVNLAQKSDNNVLLFGINGDHNNLTVSQGDNVNDTGDHRAIVDITGNYNSTSLTQYDTGFGSGQFADINVSGSDNSITSTQRETDKMLFIDVNGDDNTITTDQKDTGEHFLDITVGSDQTVSVTQQGSGDHAATIDMDGYSSTLSLNQNSSTDQIYSLDQTCATVSGCGTTTITQN